MRKRILSSVVIVLSLASIAVATYVGLQKAKAKPPVQKTAAGQGCKDDARES